MGGRVSTTRFMGIVFCEGALFAGVLEGYQRTTTIFGGGGGVVGGIPV